MCPLYVVGLIGPGERKSIQPMAERLALGDYAISCIILLLPGSGMRRHSAPLGPPVATYVQPLINKP